MNQFPNFLLTLTLTRGGLVSEMNRSGGCQFKTVSIQGLCVLTHPNKSWMFLVNKNAIYVYKCRKYEIKGYNFFIFFFFTFFGFPPISLSFPSILCVDKQDGGYKVHNLFTKNMEVLFNKIATVYDIKFCKSRYF